MPPLLTSNAALGVAFALIVFFLLALDLGLLRRAPRDPTFRQSALWTATWVGLAAAFGLGVTARMGPDAGLAFASAYLVAFAVEIPVAASLLVITTILGGAVAASLRTPSAERPQHEQA